MRVAVGILGVCQTKSDSLSPAKYLVPASIRSPATAGEMDNRRPTTNLKKWNSSPKSRSSPSAQYSRNANRPDEASRHSDHVTPVNGRGLTHDIMVTSLDGSQKPSNFKPVKEDPNSHDCRFSNVKDSAFDMQELKVTLDSPKQTYAYELSESSRSTTKKDFPLPSTMHSANEKSIDVWGEQRKQKRFDVVSAYRGDSTKARPFIEEAQFGRKTGSVDESSDSHYIYDICPQRFQPAIRLKAPLHVKNREIRNQKKRNLEEGNILILRPGMILLRSYISFNDQVKLIRTCRDLGVGPGGFYEPGYNDGAKLNLKMMCLGKHWDPVASAYFDERPSDGAKLPPIPDTFSDLVKRAITDSHEHLSKQCRKANAEDILPPMSPNICIINFYTKNGRLGLHQDKDETRSSLQKGLPVVSFSIGESAEFIYSDQRDSLTAEKIRLESGDVLIFGGQARHIFHGVTTIYPDTAPSTLMEETNLRSGRLNLTFREY